MLYILYMVSAVIVLLTLKVTGSDLVKLLDEKLYFDDVGIKLIILTIFVLAFIPFLNIVLGMVSVVGLLTVLLFKSGVINIVFNFFTQKKEEGKNDSKHPLE